MQLRITPPTETTRITAQRVLALAPHSDDEVFGCGGLLARLAAEGAVVKVLYLTDSSGGAEVTEDRDAYTARRREEARRGLEILGVGDHEILDIPDGALAEHVDVAGAAIQAAVVDHRPDLLLSVSPCEITSDHRAAFSALHLAFTSLRGGTPLDDIAATCRILLYEVNHPAYPSLLVDVSDRVETLVDAIDVHTSQLELHNYREAAMGMRHYRALSLPPEITAAEGFTEITPADLSARGLGGLIRALGGVPNDREIDRGPLVSVIVRTKDRPELLSEALASVAASSYRRVEVVLVNDGGASPSTPGAFPFPVVRVELDSNRGRAAAANAGVAAANGDYIVFLDDDDLVEPDHLEVLTGLVAAADVRVAYTDAAVGVYELDGAGGWREVERRLPYSRDFDPDLLLVDNYIPFNTLIVERALADRAGPFDTELPFFEDWEWLIRLAATTPFHHLPRVTAEYRHFRGSGHHVLGAQAHDSGDFLRLKAEVIGRHSHRGGPAATARVIDTLRAETVAAEESDATARRELAQARADLAERTEAYHRLNGECEALRGEREGMAAEIDRLNRAVDDLHHLADEVEQLRGQEHALRETIGERDEQMSLLYAEIERLGGLIEAMEGTAAWRWHRRLERLRGR